MTSIKPEALLFLVVAACVSGCGPDVAASDAAGPGGAAESESARGSPSAEPAGANAQGPEGAQVPAEDLRTGDGAALPRPALPSDLVDLTNWKLTLPTGASGKPAEVLQPALAGFASAPYFSIVSTPAGNAVAFRAPVGGVTTSNSGYPRSELREMAADGTRLASWSTTSGTHTMTLRQAITHLPDVKRHIVAGQIHDAEDDVVMIRLEGTHLFVEGGGELLAELDSDYQLGTVFEVALEAGEGIVRVRYNGELKAEIQRRASGCYFKAGAYTQSNPAKGDVPDAFGEVQIYELAVTHAP